MNQYKKPKIELLSSISGDDDDSQPLPQPSTSRHGEQLPPSSSGYRQPQQQPSSSGYRQPQQQQPSTSSHGQLQQPSSSGHNQPSSSGHCQPQQQHSSSGYSQPQQQPSSSGYSQPQQQPLPSGHNQPQQQPSSSGYYQIPSTSGLGQQPSTSTQQSTTNELQTSSSGDEEVEVPFVKRNLYSEEVRKQWNLVKVYKELGTKQQCLRFAEENQLLQSIKLCNTHRVPMHLSYAKETNSNCGNWVCSKRTCKGKAKVSRAKNTFFENIRIDIRHVFYLMYAFAHKYSIQQTLNEDPYKCEIGTTLSWVTVTDWFNYCRECVVEFQLSKQERKGKIGGPGKVVQIDESKFGKRKYNKGRAIEGHWVLGLIEDGSEDLRLEVCPDNIRSAEVLVPHPKTRQSGHHNTYRLLAGL